MMLRQIQHFQAIVQENSFTQAAELCHISQSGISQSVKALEAELGVRRIVRKNRSFALTEAGKHYNRWVTIREDRRPSAGQTAAVGVLSFLFISCLAIIDFWQN